MNYLLGVTVGPVQAYIQESRKLLDLYNSSKIISDIMREILDKITQNSTQSELIYPNNKDLNDIDYSNFLVIKIENIIDMRMIEDQVYNKFNKYKGEKIQYDIREVFYLFWAIKEIEDGDYNKAHKELTNCIRSLKNTYEFKQDKQESGKKCLMCAKHNVCTENFPSQDRNIYKLDILDINEELCPLCLFRRKYCNQKFESVYSLAIKRWKQKNEVKLKEISKSLEKIFKKEQRGKYYSEVAIDNVIKMLSSDPIKEKLKKFRELKYDDLENSELASKKNIRVFQNIKEKMDKLYHDDKEKDETIQSPNYEYCLIQFDVDNLGKWMSGKYFDYEETLEGRQQNISRFLTEFGKEIREKLKDTCCNVIYSGGDDFLGVLPNEDIINVAQKIDELFKEDVQNKVQELKGVNQQITYSMSITIAQCKDPMSYALSKTRTELENVKMRYEREGMPKNGIAISYIINNGKEITCYLRKNKLKALFELARSFNGVRKYISFSYINNFEDEMAKFDFNDITFDEMQTFCAIANYEFKRLISRSKAGMVDENNIKTYKSKMTNFTNAVISENCIEIKPNQEYIDFKNIMNVLKINKKLSMIEFDSGR